MASLARIHRLARQLEPGFRDRVRRAIRRSRRNVDLGAIEAELNRLLGLRRVRRLRRSDFDIIGEIVIKARVGRALEAETSLDEAFKAGGRLGISDLPKRVELRMNFDRLNERAVEFLDRTQFRLIREIDDETRRGVERIVRQGFVDRLPPRKQAELIRETVGLTEKQARAVYNFRRQLEVQSDTWPGAHPRLRPAAKRRLSASEQAMVRRHLREGNLDRAGVDRLVRRYQESLTNLRAQAIARTETLRASNEGQREAWREAQRQDLVRRDEAQREWLATGGSTGDGRTREEHRLAHGMRIELDGKFRMPLSGEVIDGPPHGVNCRCTERMVFDEAAS